MNQSQDTTTVYIDCDWNHEAEWQEVTRLFKFANLADRLYCNADDAKYYGTVGYTYRHNADTDYRRQQADNWRKRYNDAWDSYYSNADKHNMCLQHVKRDNDGRVLINSFDLIGSRYPEELGGRN